MKIALVPNDDGYGPSALGYYIAKVLLRKDHSIIVINESAQSLNKSFYETEIKVGTVQLQKVFGGIRLRKTAEGVDILSSLEDLRYYYADSDKYMIPNDVDAVVDIGTPAATWAACRTGRPTFTIFDHSWSKTYEMLMDNYIRSFLNTLGLTSSEALIRTTVSTSEVAKMIQRIKDEERKATTVFLFPYFIAPEPYHDHWRSLGVRTEIISGVFGAGRVERNEARRRMGITETNAPEKTVYILGGGTPVWDDKLPEIISQLKSKSLDYNIVIFDRTAKVNQYQKVGKNVYKGGAIKGETVQGLLPGVDLIITRAGGGIVNDATACRVPFVCVEEPKHEQVEMIRRNCEKQGLTRTINIDEFRTGDISQIVKREIGNHSGNNKIREAMKKIKNGMENVVVEKIIELSLKVK